MPSLRSSRLCVGLRTERAGEVCSGVSHVATCHMAREWVTEPAGYVMTCSLTGWREAVIDNLLQE